MGPGARQAGESSARGLEVIKKEKKKESSSNQRFETQTAAGSEKFSFLLFNTPFWSVQFGLITAS